MYTSKRRLNLFLLISIVILALLNLTGCGPSAADLKAVDYTPLPRDDWEVSTPEEQGLDPELVAEFYLNAADVETIKSLLVVMNVNLIAEGYFNGGTVEQKTNVMSVAKSYTSALVGIALEQGCLASIDQKMMAFFPELADKITDPRKKQITIRDMLQIRAGYPYEESTEELFDLMYTGFRPSNLVDVPLIRDPGADFDYSNLTSHLLGVIVARACDTDLKSFAQEHLFSPLGAEVGFWQQDWEGNYLGYGDIDFTARDMAKFGLLYLNDGVYEGKQLVNSDWVEESLRIYTEDAFDYRVGSKFKDVGYGYQWWSVTADDHQYNLAWGHGGQQVVLLDEYDMVIVVQSDPLHGQLGDGPWKREKENLNLVADFIASLPIK